jgi:hypothetical protein
MRIIVMIRKFQILSIAITLMTLSACVSAPKWINNGPIEITASSGITCYTDANIIDGKRMEGTLCATSESGIFGGGEPKIKFGPWRQHFISALASETTNGINRDYKGKQVLLKCAPVISTDLKIEVGRDCTVTINQQNIVSAKFIFVPR